jgi:hypothetical protein
MPAITIREAARRLGVRPRALHDRFYSGVLDDTHCDYIGSRRIIPEAKLDRIRQVLLDTRSDADQAEAN